MKLFTLGFLCLLLSSCFIDVEPLRVHEVNNATTFYTLDFCTQDPYPWEPEWCDWYDDGTTCCVWLVNGWYEEWCQDYCWEYNGAWQKDSV